VLTTTPRPSVGISRAYNERLSSGRGTQNSFACQPERVAFSTISETGVEEGDESFTPTRVYVAAPTPLPKVVVGRCMERAGMPESIPKGFGEGEGRAKLLPPSRTSDFRDMALWSLMAQKLDSGLGC
jgi:hypothetical protein